MSLKVQICIDDNWYKYEMDEKIAKKFKLKKSLLLEITYPENNDCRIRGKVKKT